MRSLLLNLIAAAALMGGVATADAAPDAALIAHCQACHGDGPRSRSDAPRLAGLSADYIFGRLKAMEQPIDQSPHAIDNMWSEVVEMPDNTKRDLAGAFAVLPAPQVMLGASGPGRDLYQRGLPEQGVASCAGCHGEVADGKGAAPRLAGQKPDYLKMQLWAFNLTARVHGPMNAGALKFSPAQIDALANYLAGK